MEKQSTEERPHCPRCSSVDTVAYWDIKRPKPDRLSLIAITLAQINDHVFRELYPNARKCVDCEHVWW